MVVENFSSAWIVECHYLFWNTDISSNDCLDIDDTVTWKHPERWKKVRMIIGLIDSDVLVRTSTFENALLSSYDLDMDDIGTWKHPEGLK